MIQSMTGYGKSSKQYGNKKITVEIKTLNSKSLDLYTRIAPDYREKEMEIRTMIGKTIERGKTDVNIWVEKTGHDAAVPVNQSLIEEYYKQIKEISQRTGIPEPEDWFTTLLRMPDVLAKVDSDELDEEEWDTLRQTIKDAMDNLVEFRTQEGASLERMFRDKTDNIERLLKSITPYEESRVDKIRERILTSLENNLSVEYDKNRLEQELIYYIEKLDISEEKQRLQNHIDYFRRTLDGPHGQGKKLNFISQEMGREINTTGSKSNQADMQNIVVQMKDELEQIKEQVCNVL